MTKPSQNPSDEAFNAVPYVGVKMEWLMDQTIDPNSLLSLARMSVEVGVLSEAHFHSNCSEVIHLLSGKIKQRIDARWRIMEAGESCVISAGCVHQTRNIGQDKAVMIVAYSEGQREYNAITSKD